jgi:hypothetical protein
MYVEHELDKPCEWCKLSGATVCCDACARDRLAWWQNLFLRSVGRSHERHGFITRRSAREYSARMERLAEAAKMMREGRS